MPLHDYLCSKCGHEFESYSPIGVPASATTECPHGCGETSDRLPSAASYRGNFGEGSTPKRPGAHLKQTAFNFDKEKK